MRSEGSTLTNPSTRCQAEIKSGGMSRSKASRSGQLSVRAGGERLEIRLLIGITFEKGVSEGSVEDFVEIPTPAG